MEMLPLVKYRRATRESDLYFSRNSFELFQLATMAPVIEECSGGRVSVLNHREGAMCLIKEGPYVILYRNRQGRRILFGVVMKAINAAEYIMALYCNLDHLPFDLPRMRMDFEAEVPEHRVEEAALTANVSYDAVDLSRYEDPEALIGLGDADLARCEYAREHLVNCGRGDISLCKDAESSVCVRRDGRFFAVYWYERGSKTALAFFPSIRDAIDFAAILPQRINGALGRTIDWPPGLM